MINPLSACVIAQVLAMAVPTSVRAQPAGGQRIALPAQPLATALRKIVLRYGIELLFSETLVEGLNAPAISGIMRADQALDAIFAGSGLFAQRSVDGSYIVVALPIAVSQNLPVPEILVVGRRTQNADIRRYTDDVQPYRVITRDEVRTSHKANVEELIGSRVSQDGRGLTASQVPFSGQGSPQSSIDLRGLGTDETLLLVDGRRLPRLPNRGLQFVQSDVNALSPNAIDRAEIITSTAGGIYGPGAIAGVVNLVLDRNYRGAEIAVTNGITQRGDAPYHRFDARIGFTPDDGATDVMLAYSHSSSGGLQVGDRDYRQRASELAFAQPLALYQLGDLPNSNSTNVISPTGEPLVLKPGYGGAALGSQTTSLASGDGRSQMMIGDALLANAGKLDFAPSNTAGGAEGTLVVGRETSSIIGNVRHRFVGDSVEIYGDFLRLTDRGRVTYQDNSATLSFSADNPLNPFLQPIDVSFPVQAYRSTGGQRITITRASVGALIKLPAMWKANFDYSVGRARQKAQISGVNYTINGFIALLGFDFSGVTKLNPFGDSSALQSTLLTNSQPVQSSTDQTSHLSDLTARFGGPLFTLAGGPLSMTLLAEQRKESVGPGLSRASLLGTSIVAPSRAYSERVTSAYVEIRAPLISDHSKFALLRGLEAQLAVRHDITRVSLGPNPNDDPTIIYDRFTSAKRAATVFTAGLKFRPLEALLVRASIATGETSPPLNEIGFARVSPLATDPKRGERRLGSELPFDVVVFGNKITPERAQSLSAGFVLSPFKADGPTLSLDFTRIRRTREVDGRLTGSVFSFIYNEDLYPGRVTRQALTPEDAALGFAGGIVTRVDTSYLQVGHTSIDAVDGRLDLPVRTKSHGNFALHAAATWQPRYKRYVLPGVPSEDFVNQALGTLEWRANAGITWNHGPMLLALNAQYFGQYKVTQGSVLSELTNARSVSRQGSDVIPAQLTFDVAAGYRFTLDAGGQRPRTLELRFGIQDLLDRRPSTVVAAEGSYSYYADPRRRRFDLTAAVGF